MYLQFILFYFIFGFPAEFSGGHPFEELLQICHSNNGISNVFCCLEAKFWLACGVLVMA